MLLWDITASNTVKRMGIQTSILKYKFGENYSIQIDNFIKALEAHQRPKIDRLYNGPRELYVSKYFG